MRPKKPPLILIAEDDDDQYELTSSALSEYRSANLLRRVVDGEDLMNYLLRHGDYKNEALYPKPSFILLDLNMPKKDGRQALKEIKSNAELRSIPVTVLTVSRDEKDIDRMYALGANSYITKPIGFTELEQAMKSLEAYWFQTAQIPKPT